MMIEAKYVMKLRLIFIRTRDA